MDISKQWLIRVNFKDGGYREDISKKSFREDGIIEIIRSTEKMFPNKQVVSVESL